MKPEVTIDALRWRSIVDTARDGIITIDQQGRVTSFNRAASDMFGYSAAEVIGRNISMLMPEPYQGAHDGHLARYLTTGERRIMGTIRPVQGLRADGRIIPIELSVSEGGTGEDRFFTGVIRDVLATQRRYHQVVELAEAIIVVLDRDLNVVEFNQYAERTFGLQREAVFERPFVELFPLPARANLTARLEAARSGARRDGHLEGLIDASERYISWRISPLGHTGGLIALGHDLTARRAAESNLRHERAKVVHADKLSSIGQLAAGVAHEVNNPLAGVKSLSAALRAGRVAPARVDTYHQAIADGLDRIERTVRALLDYARPSHGAVADLDLHALIESCLRLTRSTFNKKRLRVEVRLEPGEWIVRGDRHGLLQALMNVVLNAIYASPAGGEITLYAERVGQQILLHAEDDGPGIPQENLRRICDPFFSTKPEGQGTGLGLAVTQSILAGQGGALEVGNTERRGARITFRLPAASGDGPSADDDDA